MLKYYFVLLVLILTGCKPSMTDLKSDFTLDNNYSVMEMKYSASETYGEYEISYTNDLSHYFFYYNSDKEVLKQHIFNYEGEKVWTLNNTFDKNKDKVVTSYQFKDQEKTIINRVFKDHKIQELNYSNDKGEIKSYHYYSYFGDSLEIIEEKNKNGELEARKKFVKENNQIHSIINESEDGQVEYTTYYDHNENGDIIKESKVYPAGKKIKVSFYRYDYDHNNNWTRKYHFNENKDLQFIHVRNIRYNNEKQKNIEDQDIIGKWFVNGREHDYLKLNADKTFFLNNKKSESINGVWELSPRKSKLILKQNENDTENNITFSYYFQGDLFILNDDHYGNEMTLEKRNPLKYNVNNKNLSKGSFMNKWKVIGEEDSWFNFKNDSSYEFIYNGKLVDEAEWQLKTNNNELILKDGKFHGIKFKYVYDQDILSIYDEDGSRYFKLETK